VTPSNNLFLASLNSLGTFLEELPFMLNIEERKFVILTLQAFLDGTGGTWDFDDLVHDKFSDDLARAAVKAADNMPLEYPSNHPNEFCNSEGSRKIQQLVDELKASID
jgi:hypothetical protein